MPIHKKDFTLRLRVVLKRCLILLAVTALAAAVLTGAGWMLRYRILAAYLGISQPVYGGMVVEKDVMVPMRDGVRLATDIYRPDGAGPFPAILIRLPYDKKPLQEVPVGRFSFAPGILFAQRGLALIIQDVRGRYASEGDFYAFSHERQDSEDVVRWLREQPWFNGDLGAAGPSYLGYTQWALAPAAGDTMKCMAPMVISADLRDLFYRDGAICLETGGGWAVGVGERKGGDHPKEDFETGMWHLPLMEADDVTGADVDFFNDWLAHPLRDAYWDALNRRPEIPNITAPALLIGGWYDIAAGGMLEDYQALRASAGS
ncbi:MAG TPA: CocE/NonD family hydrolase, partial [Candidatus Hydrogenedentes bacterium]|nr:CocE/NonD family hydrolase [Candidatus Hydrogenedentota bacterium]